MIPSFLCNDTYNKVQHYDERLFSQSSIVRKGYDAFPTGARILSLPICIIWAGIKTALSPIIDLVCIAVFPVLFVKTLDRSYLKGTVNAIINLAYIATFVVLTILAMGTSHQGTMLYVSISAGGSLFFTAWVRKASFGLRGPLHKEDKKGLMSTLFDKFKPTEVFRLFTITESNIGLREDIIKGFEDLTGKEFSLPKTFY